ncbi:pyrroline-5-carboxylate reductase [Rhizobium binxianense]|uniref:pyrroline-5-carboxylate reductase n=1 Tax=Rhizobium binxianense TaxID=3024242 RepID=UPI002361327F|nr:pyrroline-5-carboxylate reductase [Rhizobium sp. MJ37]MDC9837816.1 pyrroline-5-carboxylate reductase [Rhizobium sp. MJ37]
MNILLIGCGNMGAAIAGALVNAGNHSISIVDPDLSKVRQFFPVATSVEMVTHIGGLKARSFDVAIIAVKPHLVQSTLQLAAQAIGANVTLSIAAGVDIASMRRWASPETKLVRTMPNLAASVGHSMTVAVSDELLDSEEREDVEAVLGTIGKFAWLPDEALIDPVTAVAGSGPAYVFAFAEHLTSAAIGLGLSRELASDLVRQTVIGAARLLENSDQEFADLKRAVTSPRGTTAAGLSVLEGVPGFPEILRLCVSKAVERAGELRKEAATADR